MVNFSNFKYLKNFLKKLKILIVPLDLQTSITYIRMFLCIEKHFFIDGDSYFETECTVYTPFFHKRVSLEVLLYSILFT